MIQLTIFYEVIECETLSMSIEHETITFASKSPAFRTLEDWAVTNGYDIAIVEVVA